MEQEAPIGDWQVEQQSCRAQNVVPYESPFNYSCGYVHSSLTFRWTAPLLKEGAKLVKAEGYATFMTFERALNASSESLLFNL
jgi:hypothetical protein